MTVPELLTDERAILGESPRWDDRTGTVHWLDVDAGLVLSADLVSGGVSRRRELGAPVGALVLHEDGGVVCAVQDSWCRPDALHGPRVGLGTPDLRFNDAGVDADGGVWSATMRHDEGMEPPGLGALYRIEERAAQLWLGGLVAGNGIAWSGDERWMYLVDSGTRGVLRSRFEVGAGPVGGWAPWLSFGAAPPSAMPDGVATDADGGVWVAVWGTGEVVRFDRTGVRTHALRLPTPSVTALCFAGADLDLLVVTTSSQDVPADVDPLAGRTFVAPAPVPGVPLHRARWRGAGG
jgi:sugar lactone lactonase YvrE